MKKISFLVMMVVFVACSENNTSEQSSAADTTSTTPAALPDPGLATADTAGVGLNVAGYVCPPCACSMHDTVFVASGTCPACNMALTAKTAPAN